MESGERWGAHVAEEQALHPEALAAAVFEAAADGILVIDEQGLIQAINRSALQSFGFAEDELLGQCLAVLMPDAYAGVNDGYPHSLLPGARNGREVMGRRRDASSFPLYLSMSEFRLAGRRLFACVCHDISERRKLTERMVFLAAHDTLTGCLNRDRLLQMLEQAMLRCRRGGGRLAALFIDLDGFKPINDNHGHRVGDRLLQQVAERFQGILRDTDMLGRVGGDEFVAAVMLDDEPGQAEVLGWRLIDGLREPFVVEGISLMLRASIGISLFPGQCRSAEELVDEADMAMYRAKLDGGNCIRLFSQPLREASERQYRMLGRLRQALMHERFELRYQPQFDLGSMRPCALEALPYWHDEELGVLSVEQFAPLALKHGLMSAIERWSVERACRDNRWLMAQGMLGVPVAVNVRSSWFAEPAFVDWLRQVLQDNDLPAARLVLEIDEETVMRDWDRVLMQANTLHAFGVGLVLDGFGSGHSSLGRLRHLPVSRLKMDPSFVRGLPGSAGDKAVVHAILGISRSLYMQVAAEGIESTAQLAYLKAEGCDLGQGSRLAAPMPLAALVEWLGRQGMPA